MKFIDEGVSVGPAPYGLGVYSLRKFPMHELLGPIEGAVMNDPLYESDYCMELGENQSLEPAAPFRFLNHSCHPNCELVEMEAEAEDGTPAPRLWIETLSEIFPGEQMTIDYNWPAHAAIPCHCGSANCRGWIVTPDELHKIQP